MDKFLYYFDKWTAWLDFSWLITRPREINSNKIEPDEEQFRYEIDPYHYDVEPLLDSYHK